MTIAFKYCLNCDTRNAPRKRKCRECGGDMFRPATEQEVAEYDLRAEQLNRLVAEFTCE